MTQTAQIIPFPTPEVLDVSDMPINHIQTYCKDNGWDGFNLRRWSEVVNDEVIDHLEIRRTFGKRGCCHRLSES